MSEQKVGCVPDGYMPIPTAEQLADALDGVRCFHDMSAELIAPELLANLLAVTTVKESLSVAPSLPAAGSAEEEVEVVAWRYRHSEQEKWQAGVERKSLWETEPLMTVAQHERIAAALSAQQSVRASVPRGLLDAVKELFDAKQAKEDFERENPGNSTKRWDACLYRIEAAEDALRALLNGGEA